MWRRAGQTLLATRNLEAQRAREAALQKYLEQMQTLLVDQDLHNVLPTSDLGTVARAQTLAVLEALDETRKRIVLQFLYESGLIKKPTQNREPVINLAGANLRKADLHDLNLSDADMHGTSLQEADLSGATLRKTNLKNADLEGANLEGADLKDAQLDGVKSSKVTS